MTSPAAPEVGVIIVAAGSGVRLGAAEPKAFVRMRGRTILEHALRGVIGASEPATVVLVAPVDRTEEARAIADAAGVPEAIVIAGGATRQASVAAGLAVLPAGTSIVLVHDAARALTPSALVDRVVGAVRDTGSGVIPTLPVTDTVKHVSAAGAVLETVDRTTLGAVQTPQGFPLDALREAYAGARDEHTDDAALFAAAGGEVLAIAGEPDAFKITTPWDLRRAEGLLGGGGILTGIGVDVHAFDPDAELWLGGLFWPGEQGLRGHSDGDVLVHAICDALLSAAGLGDLGSRFGSADPRFAGARGAVFLTETLRLLGEAGVTVGNVAVQLIGARPRISARRAELERHLSREVGAPVSVAATTTDGLGFPGRGEGLTAIATALVVS